MELRCIAAAGTIVAHRAQNPVLSWLSAARAAASSTCDVGTPVVDRVHTRPLAAPARNHALPFCSWSACPQVLTLPAFPTSVMGTVVNKRAKYSYMRLVQDSESLTYRCARPCQAVQLTK